VLHGAGSVKESHYDFARLCRDAGLAAVSFDQRGHGESEGALDDRAIDDIAVMRTLLPPDAPVALRGSSMGGWMALAASERVRAAAVIAICPATSDGPAARPARAALQLPRRPRALSRVLAAHDPEVAAADLDERLLLLHAEATRPSPSRSPAASTGRAPHSRLIVTPGHHRSIQHDEELQASPSLARAAAARGGSDAQRTS
jgi:pimeloyl-ACP methyl ester carboxylesterase